MAEIIDINVSEVVENIQITTTENITTVNINKVTGSGVNWGEIFGNLSDQTDLQDALDLKANISELGTTAFSNDYNDLANKPNIPTLTSQLTNNSGFITNVITALGFTPENSANKSTSVTTDSASNTKYPSVKAVFDWANSVFTTPSAVATQITTALVGYATQSWVNSQGFITNVITALGFTPENIANKATDFTSPNNTTFPTTQAVINENKKATITVELINLLTTSFYAPNALRINSTALINGSGTITLKVNDVAYTLGNLIAQGAKITVETTTASVYNLIVIYE